MDLISPTVKNIVLIGTSTGGPKALTYLLDHLQPRGDTAILIVQHMPPVYTKSLAKRLHDVTAHEVKEAVHHEVICGQTVYIAPGGYHMELEDAAENIKIKIHQDAPRNGHRPSVDLLFQSAATLKSHRLAAVVLTGMGKDGTAGLTELLKFREVYTIAEDASTCIVYGMPKAAIAAQIIDDILPLDLIPTSLNRWLAH